MKEGEKYVDEGKRPPSILTKPPQKDPSVDFLAQEYVTSPPPQQDSDKDLFEGRVDGLYLVLISLHGLVRGERMELGKDPDTGGQVQPTNLHRLAHVCCILVCAARVQTEVASSQEKRVLVR